MAIKINGQDLLKRFINGQEIVRVYKNGGQIRPETVPPSYTPGIYRNANLGLISLSYDGISRITMADKNIGAVNLGDNGYAFQWGNNHPNILTPQTDVITGPVDASNYAPSTYESEKFIVSQGEWVDWTSPDNDDLWGSVTNTNEARRGPCNEGFHVPSTDDYGTVQNHINELGVGYHSRGDSTLGTYRNYFYYPRSTYGIGWDGNYGTGSAYSTWVWTSDPFYAWRLYSRYGISIGLFQQGKASGFVIRPFKNTPVIPDDTRIVLYQPS